ncbi:hypothetical protein CLOP_g613 [Closterium sp. NIES-67]|nr:hypothetical protein CLOP_g613 [Closterium sp. NIES-67]
MEFFREGKENPSRKLQSGCSRIRLINSPNYDSVCAYLSTDIRRSHPCSGVYSSNGASGRQGLLLQWEKHVAVTENLESRGSLLGLFLGCGAIIEDLAARTDSGIYLDGRKDG